MYVKNPARYFESLNANSPECAGSSGWRTYNFEVDNHHTYIADGMRVHNTSELYPLILEDMLEEHGRIDPLRKDFYFKHGYDAGDDGRVQWVDTDGHPHWGDIDAYERALENNTVRPGSASGGGDAKLNRDQQLERNIEMHETHAENARRDGNDALADSHERSAERARDELREIDQNSDVSPTTTDQNSQETPILLDLNGNGIEITEFSQSTMFLDSSGDGLENRTSWAAPGDGVLFFDADGDGAISEALEFIFTEWDPTAATDIAALKAVFDTDDDGDIDANDPATWDVNGDGVVNASDKPFNYFKVLVTNEDGSQEAKTLAQLGITSLNLNEDATNIELPDGSVITGKASFSYSGGGTGTLGDVTLVADGQSYRVTRSDTVANGERKVVQTGYDASGAVAFVFTAVSALDGSEVTNFYDDNGDGVVDRVQTIEIATTVGVETERKVTNYIGSDVATGVLVNETSTTRSADGSSVTIQRDTKGGGWIDQEETRILQANGAWHITIKDYAPDETTVIRKTFETLTATGQQRTDRVDLDGDGDWDVTTTQTLSATQDPRTETFVVTNTDGSTRRSHTEVMSLDGTDRTVSRDLDGDGVADVEEVTDLTILADGSTQTNYEVLNGDGSLRYGSTIAQSDDALITTTVSDLDGDGDTDLTTHDATVLNADGSRMQTVAKTNTDGSVRSKVRVELDADRVGMTRKVDLAQDGVFDATDLIDEVVVDAVTSERVASHWDRNPDGSIRATSVATTSTDGLSTTTELDSDGDGDLDLTVTDVTTLNANGTTTRIVTRTSQNDDLLGADTILSSADGLDATTSSDLDGDGLTDQVRSVTFSENPDGSRLETEQLFAGDGTTLLYSHTVLESADRLNALTTIDADGDGNTDETRQKVIASDGSSVTTVTRFAPDGTTIDVTRIETSANGLVSTTSVDLDGDSFDDRIQLSSKALQDDGSTILTTETQNRDGSTRSLTVLETSDDGLETTLDLDADGDGVFERSTETQTDLLSGGGTSTLTTPGRPMAQSWARSERMSATMVWTARFPVTPMETVFSILWKHPRPSCAMMAAPWIGSKSLTGREICAGSRR